MENAKMKITGISTVRYIDDSSQSLIMMGGRSCKVSFRDIKNFMLSGIISLSELIDIKTDEENGVVSLGFNDARISKLEELVKEQQAIIESLTKKIESLIEKQSLSNEINLQTIKESNDKNVQEICSVLEKKLKDEIAENSNQLISARKIIDKHTRVLRTINKNIDTIQGDVEILKQKGVNE